MAGSRCLEAGAGAKWLEAGGWRQVVGGRLLEAGGSRHVAAGVWS